MNKNYLLVILSGCLWGTLGVYVKFLTEAGSSSAYTSFLRVGFAFILLLIFAMIKEKPKAFRISKKSMISCILFGIICMGLNTFLYAEAITQLGMSMAVAIAYVAPVFTAMFSKAIFKEKIGPLKIFAFILTVAGCALAVTGGSLTDIKVSLIGLGFGLGAAITYSLSGVLGRIGAENDPPLVIAAYNMLFATLFLAISTRPWNTVANPLDGKIIMLGLLYGLIPTAIAYMLYFMALENIKETSKVPVLASVEVVVSTIIGVMYFKENMLLVNLLGIAIILFSIVLMSKTKNRKNFQTIQKSDMEIEVSPER